MSRIAVNHPEAVLPVGALPSGMYLAQLRMADGRQVVRPFVKD